MNDIIATTQTIAEPQDQYALALSQAKRLRQDAAQQLQYAHAQVAANVDKIGRCFDASMALANLSPQERSEAEQVRNGLLSDYQRRQNKLAQGLVETFQATAIADIAGASSFINMIGAEPPPRYESEVIPK
jgi:hypothetical protein